MKAQKFVLSAIALVVAVGGALAFKAKIPNVQLYTLNGPNCNNTGYVTGGSTTTKGEIFPGKQLYTAGVCTTVHQINPVFVTLNTD